MKLRGRVYKGHVIVFVLTKGYISAAGYTVDHINRDPLDNSQDNLRAATRVEQMRNQGKRRTNTSGMSNVSWHQRDKKWAPRVRVGNRLHALGYRDDLDEAARAADAARIMLYGEFVGHRNFPDRAELSTETIAALERIRSKKSKP